MRRISTIFATIAALVIVLVSCQKEDSGTMTFTAHCESGSDKVYLNNDYYFNWESTDQVAISGTSGQATFSVAPSSSNPTSATLTGPSVGNGPYTAIYPASIANSQGQIVLPSRQITTNGNLLNFPMRAVSDPSNDHLLNFYNLCAAIRLRIPACSVAISRVEVISGGNAISGQGSIRTQNLAWTGNGQPYAELPYTASKHVTLDITDHQAYNEAHDYYITLPAGSYQSGLTFYIFNPQGLVCTKTLQPSGGFNLHRSQVTTVELTGQIEFREGTAQLKPQAFINKADITQVIFHYNSSEYSEVHLEAPGSIPIYQIMQGTVCHVHTMAAGIKAPDNSQSLFSGCTNLQSINFGTGFSTSNVTTMDKMFEHCSSLTSIDLSTFNTTNVTNMKEMFKNCDGFTSLDLSNFNTANVTTMQGMFHSCTHLTDINLTNFNTTSVTDMSYMFFDCRSLSSLGITMFNTASVTTMQSMFQRCQSLTTLNLESFNSHEGVNITNIFRESRLRNIRFNQSFSTTNVTDACNNLGSTDAPCTIYCHQSFADILRNLGSAREGYVIFNTSVN